MIYLRRKYDIISVPPYAEGIYHRSQNDIIASAISPVPTGTDIIEKNLFCQWTKETFFLSMGYKKDIFGSFAYEFELSRKRHTISMVQFKGAQIFRR